VETANLSTNATTLEWLQDRKGRIFFIDIKSVPEEFFSGKKDLLRGFELSTFITLDLPLGDARVRNIGEREEGVFLIERPLYNYMDNILQHASAVVCKRGGVLSHLVVYATKKGIPCVISDSSYNKCFTEKEVNLSSVALLTSIDN
jgi:phosphoenolpyruvate synthase/pyruvate phosphate dikinase